MTYQDRLFHAMDQDHAWKRAENDNTPFTTPKFWQTLADTDRMIQGKTPAHWADILEKNSL